MTGAALAVRGLVTGYGRVPVLHGVDLAMGEGEALAILGVNGAGKTTLLRALAGALPAWAGTIELDGRDISHRPPWGRVRRGLAHVAEGRHVFATMTVRENLDVAGTAVRAAPAHRRVFDLFPRLEARQDQTAGTLSGGEQQMLAVGRALMTRPRLLLVDEMSAGLAGRAVDDLVDGLVVLRGEGTSLLVVEQSPHVIVGLVDRIAVLERGSITFEGSLEAAGSVAGVAARYLGWED